MPDIEEKLRFCWGLFARAVLQNVTNGEITLHSIMPNVNLNVALPDGEELTQATIAPIIYVAQFERSVDLSKDSVLELELQFSAQPTLPKTPVAFAAASPHSIVLTQLLETSVKVIDGKVEPLTMTWVYNSKVIGSSVLPVAVNITKL